MIFTVIFLPDQYLAKYVAAHTKVKIISWHGACEVHERFTADELRGYIFREILIGQEDDGVAAQALDHLERVRGGATNVDLRLYLGRGVDIGDDRHAREFRTQQTPVI